MLSQEFFSLKQDLLIRDVNKLYHEIHVTIRRVIFSTMFVRDCLNSIMFCDAIVHGLSLLDSSF